MSVGMDEYREEIDAIPLNQSDRIEKTLREILEKVDDVQTKMAKVEEMTATVIAEVKPTIDDFMNSSLGKMLGVKKK